MPTVQIFRGEGTLAGESEADAEAAVATRTPGAFFLPPCWLPQGLPECTGPHTRNMYSNQMNE